MPELFMALDAFLQEHRRCGVLESGVDGGVVWMTCECGARIVRAVISLRGRFANVDGDSRGGSII
jgi:hypothetical protein